MSLRENVRQMWSWPSARMFTTKRPALRIAGHVSDRLPGQNRISGGSSETDVSEFTASPCGSPSHIAVTIDAPVA